MAKTPKFNKRTGLYGMGRGRRAGTPTRVGNVLRGIGGAFKSLVGATKEGDLRRARRKSKRAGRKAEREMRKEIKGNLMDQGMKRGAARRTARTTAPMAIQSQKDAKRDKSTASKKERLNKDKSSSSYSSQFGNVPSGASSYTPPGVTSTGSKEKPTETKSIKSDAPKRAKVVHSSKGTTYYDKEGVKTKFVEAPEDRTGAKREAFDRAVREQKLSGGLGYSGKGGSADSYYDTSTMKFYNPHMANPEYDPKAAGGHVDEQGFYVNPRMMYKPQEQQDLERKGIKAYWDYKQKAGDKAISRDEWLAGEGSQYVYKGKTDKYIPFRKGGKSKRAKEHLD